MTLSQTTIRVAFLYIPLGLCAAFVLIKRPDPRHLAGALMALLWAMPALLVVEVLARRAGWWHISAPPGVFPIAGDVWLGWAMAWGPLPALALWRRPAVALCLAWWVDVCMMPVALNLVSLGRAWLAGELVALTFVLLPGLLLTRWTIERRRLRARALLQMLIFGAWTLWLVPWAAVRVWPHRGPVWWPALVLATPFGVVAASAVQEFVRRGGGTPLPWDPPDRLVTSGPYAYVTNPMQLSMTLVFLALAAAMRNPLLALGAVIATTFGSGVAEWHEGVQMRERFGRAWDDYRHAVRPWIPRLRPYASQPSAVYVAATCDLCSGVGAWIARRRPSGLLIEAAETLSDPPRRMMYVPANGGAPEYGVAAFARTLEHVNPAWAVAGFALRLPVVRPLAQVLLDAAGAGPRDIAPSCDLARR